MTDAHPPATVGGGQPDHDNDIRQILVDAWRQHVATAEPPTVWLGVATARIREHIQHLLADRRIEQVRATAEATAALNGELEHLRTTLRQQIDDLITNADLDLEQANALLDACGTPVLQRRYTVRFTLPFTVRVNATNAPAAEQAALDALADALIPDGDDVVPDWEDVRQVSHDTTDPHTI